MNHQALHALGANVRWASAHAWRKYTHTRPMSHMRSTKHCAVGVSFDIDGVLLRGYNPLPHAQEMLQRLVKAEVPFVFLTNGGGETEERKAAKLSECLNIQVHPSQVILSHTPLRPIIQNHAHQKILVLGCRDVMSVARSYGAKRIFDIPSLAQDDPLRYPFLHFDRKEITSPTREEPFRAVFILHDPNNWGAEIQIAIDVIRGGWPLGSGGNTQKVPVYTSNPDLIFAGLYPVPRFACGAFTECLKLLWRQSTGTELNVTQCGKPTKLTFDFAHQQLRDWAHYLQEHRFYEGAAGDHSSTAHEHPPTRLSPATHVTFDHLFHIGDNPAADCRGALNAGSPWKGILVRSGVYQGTEGSNDREHPGHVCVAGVKEAIDYALSHV